MPITLPQNLAAIQGSLVHRMSSYKAGVANLQLACHKWHGQPLCVARGDWTGNTEQRTENKKRIRVALGESRLNL